MRGHDGFVDGDMTWGERIGERARCGVGGEKAVISDRSVKSWRRNERGEPAQKLDGR